MSFMIAFLSQTKPYYIALAVLELRNPPVSASLVMRLKACKLSMPSLILILFETRVSHWTRSSNSVQLGLSVRFG